MRGGGKVFPGGSADGCVQAKGKSARHPRLRLVPNVRRSCTRPCQTG